MVLVVKKTHIFHLRRFSINCLISLGFIVWQQQQQQQQQYAGAGHYLSKVLIGRGDQTRLDSAANMKDFETFRKIQENLRIIET
jgi:hypothetical protein